VGRVEAPGGRHGLTISKKEMESEIADRGECGRKKKRLGQKDAKVGSRSGERAHKPKNRRTTRFREEVEKKAGEKGGKTEGEKKDGRHGGKSKFSSVGEGLCFSGTRKVEKKKKSG